MGTHEENQRTALLLFVAVVFSACSALTFIPALEVLFDYVIQFFGPPDIGRRLLLAVAHTDLSPKLIAGVSGVITLGVALIASPSKGTLRWSIFTYGSMAALAVCVFMILIYGANPGAIEDLGNIGIGTELVDAEIETLRKSIQVLYSGLAIWFAGLILSLVRGQNQPDAAPGPS